jgi:hypothetical protein
MDVVTLLAAEQAKLREMVKPVVEKYTDVIGENLIKQARSDMAKAR